MTVDAILVYSPEKELEILASFAEVGKEIDWKPAIILAAAYLEKFGIEKLQRHFKEKTIKLGRKLEHLSLNHVTTLLYGLGLIENKDFTQMGQIWGERINIVHPKRKLPAYVGEAANKKYGKMVRNALRIIESLKGEKG